MKHIAAAFVVLSLFTVAPPARGADSSSGALSASDVHRDLRRLWSDHVIWTRAYAVAALDGHPSANAAAARLLRNQEDIGRAMVPFYGDGAGQKLTALLKEHITIAVDLIAAAKGGNADALQKADAAWQRNGVDIAEFLGAANPHWPRAALVDMMKGHLSTTSAMVTARLNRDWEADARAFDEVYAHILHMSDALAAGLVKQFPDRFKS